MDEIQQSDRLFKHGMTVVDLGAAPEVGRHAVRQIGDPGRVIACDILEMDPIVGVDFYRAISVMKMYYRLYWSVSVIKK